MLKNLKLIISLLIICLPLSAHADKTENARKFVENLADETINLLKNTSINDEEKQKVLNGIFQKNVNTKWIGKFALGKYFRSLSKEQKIEYLDLYTDFITANYVMHFKKFNNQKIDIVSVSDLQDGDIMVKTAIKQPSNPNPISVSYLVRDENGAIKIFDIVAEGVSLISTQRSEFNSVISSNGVDFLLEMLRKRVNK